MTIMRLAIQRKTPVVGKPFTTRTGAQIPAYAAPLLKQYIGNPPTGDIPNYQVHIPEETIWETTDAIRATLAKLNNGKDTDELDLLPLKEYQILTTQGQTRVSKRPSDLMIPGTAVYERELYYAIATVRSLWAYLEEAFQLPFKEVLNLPNHIATRYKRDAEYRGVSLFLTHLAGSVGLGVASIPMAIGGIGWPVCVGIGLTLSCIVGAESWMESYKNMVVKHREKKFYSKYVSEELELAEKEIKSFLIQHPQSVPKKTKKWGYDRIITMTDITEIL